jgi:hypothetical protein
MKDKKYSQSKGMKEKERIGVSQSPKNQGPVIVVFSCFKEHYVA